MKCEICGVDDSSVLVHTVAYATFALCTKHVNELTQEVLANDKARCDISECVQIERMILGLGPSMRSTETLANDLYRIRLSLSRQVVVMANELKNCYETLSVRYDEVKEKQDDKMVR